MRSSESHPDSALDEIRERQRRRIAQEAREDRQIKARVHGGLHYGRERLAMWMQLKLVGENQLKLRAECDSSTTPVLDRAELERAIEATRERYQSWGWWKRLWRVAVEKIDSDLGLVEISGDDSKVTITLPGTTRLTRDGYTYYAPTHVRMSRSNLRASLDLIERRANKEDASAPQAETQPLTG